MWLNYWIALCKQMTGDRKSIIVLVGWRVVGRQTKVLRSLVQRRVKQNVIYYTRYCNWNQWSSFSLHFLQRFINCTARFLAVTASIFIFISSTDTVTSVGAVHQTVYYYRAFIFFFMCLLLFAQQWLGQVKAIKRRNACWSDFLNRTHVRLLSKSWAVALRIDGLLLCLKAN